MKYGELRPGDLWVLNHTIGRASAAWLIFKVVFVPRTKNVNIGMLRAWSTKNVVSDNILDFFENRDNGPSELTVTIIRRHK